MKAGESMGRWGVGGISLELKMRVFRVSLSMLKVWSQPVLDVWVIVFRQLIDILHYYKIEKEILQTISILSDISQPTISRYAAARLIGLISKVSLSCLLSRK